MIPSAADSPQSPTEYRAAMPGCELVGPPYTRGEQEAVYAWCERRAVAQRIPAAIRQHALDRAAYAALATPPPARDPMISILFDKLDGVMSVITQSTRATAAIAAQLAQRPAPSTPAPHVAAMMPPPEPPPAPPGVEILPVG